MQQELFTWNQEETLKIREITACNTNTYTLINNLYK